MKEHVSTLLSMKYMVENGWDISIQGRYVRLGAWQHPLLMENYFLVRRWKPTDLHCILYTEQELRTLHRSFDHPSVEVLEKLLDGATGSRLERSTMDSVEEIKINCTICRKTATDPSRFKLTVGSAELKFNHSVQVDTMFIHRPPVLHMIDEATHFCTTRFL